MQDDKELTFGYEYAKYYDLMYSKKNYRAEALYIDKLIKKHTVRKNNLLEVACGTGNYLARFKKLGYDVEGLDISQDMLNIAKNKVKGVKLYCIPMQEMGKTLDYNPDIIVCLFNAIDYLTEDSDIERFFSVIKHNLADDGVFIFDYRNGIMALQNSSKNTSLKVKSKEIEIQRKGKHTIYPLLNITKSVYKTTIKKDKEKIRSFKECHNIRYFFPAEMRYMLKLAGFKKVYMYPFMKNEDINEKNWHITVVAKCV